MTRCDHELTGVRSKWGWGWKIWRGRRYCDVDGERTGDWVATRMDPRAGIWPTVMRATAEQLDGALYEQLVMVARGETPPRLSDAGPE